MDHKIKNLEGLHSFSLSKLKGTDRWYYQTSEISDFYDLNMMKVAGGLGGSVIVFVSYPDGEIIKPFVKREGIYYDKPIFLDGNLYFLRADFNKDLVGIIRLDPNTKESLEVYSREISEIDLYNLTLNKYPLMMTSSSNNLFRVYYPEEITMTTETTESFTYRLGDDFYFYSWGERGVLQNGLLGSDYQYYENIVIRDRQGQVKSSQEGSLEEMDNGVFWKF